MPMKIAFILGRLKNMQEMSEILTLFRIGEVGVGVGGQKGPLPVFHL